MRYLLIPMGFIALAVYALLILGSVGLTAAMAFSFLFW